MFNNAQVYDTYVGRWSRLVAQPFIAWINPAPGLSWLDMGAGTGILTEVILQKANPAKIIGVDLSPEFIELAHQRIHDSRVEFKIEDAAKIAFGSPQFDVSVAGLVLNFLPAPEQGLKTMTQAVKSGGIVAAYVWDYGGQMQMMRHFWDAAAKVDPASKALDAGQQFAIARPENLRSAFQAAGLTAVDVIPIDVQTQFKDFEDYWQPFQAAQGSVSKYLRGLNDETRTAIADQLQRQLPIANDGTITLVARAWAAKGKV